jgi:hypothetical protein
MSERVKMERKEQDRFYYFWLYSVPSGSALPCLET